MKQPSPVSPFAAPKKSPAPAVRWGIAASGPPVNPSEIETSERAAEVTILWGDEVLHVAHISPPRDFVIGESGAGTSPDYLIGREVLGTDRLAVVIEREGQLCCVIPEGARGEVRVGETKRSLVELEAEGKLVPYDGLAGAKLYVLPDGASARIEHRGLSFAIRPTSAARALGGANFKLRHTGWIGLSLAVHAIFLVLFYFMPPRSSALSLEDTNVGERMAQYLVEARATEEEPLPEWSTLEPEEGGRPGERAADEEGQAGDPDERPTRNRMAVAGDANDPNPQLARERVRENMQNIAAIGALRNLVGNWNAPTSPYGADQAHGNDPMSAIGALLGDQIGSNFGNLGLGMRGTGRGAGGNGLGTYGLGELGTIGTCGGERCGDGNGGYGRTVTLDSRRRPPAGPRVITQSAVVRGGLSQEAIRRVVHRHLNEVRFCYEQGLQQNPSIQGRVTVSWIIAGDGRVQSSGLSSSSLSNGRVESCIVGAVQRWTFPSPDGGGAVGVNYPFVLQSND